MRRTTIVFLLRLLRVGRGQFGFYQLWRRGLRVIISATTTVVVAATPPPVRLHEHVLVAAATIVARRGGFRPCCECFQIGDGIFGQQSEGHGWQRFLVS